MFLQVFVGATSSVCVGGEEGFTVPSTLMSMGTYSCLYLPGSFQLLSETLGFFQFLFFFFVFIFPSVSIIGDGHIDQNDCRLLLINNHNFRIWIVDYHFLVWIWNSHILPLPFPTTFSGNSHFELGISSLCSTQMFLYTASYLIMVLHVFLSC